MPFGPVPLYGFNSSIKRKTSLGVQGSKTNEFELRSGRYLSNVLRIGVLLFFKIFSATVVKYSLKLLHISLLSVISSLFTSIQLGELWSLLLISIDI